MVGEDAYGATNLHPLGLIAVLLLGVVLVAAPRSYAIYPVIVLACIIPSAQRLVLFGLDFSLLRILVLFGWGRLCLQNEFAGYRWNRLDTAVILWMVSGTVIYTLQQGNFSALVNRLGWMFDGCGMYFLFRCALRDWNDLERVTYCLLIMSIPISMAFALEYGTGRNIFSIFGGVPEFTMVREGRLRCQGAIQHPILAGCFWASILPLVAVQLRLGKKWLASVGIASCLFIVFASSSSTPIMSVLLAFLGVALFRYRNNLAGLRWGFVGLLILLQILMEKPVWHLLARVNAVGGSTGWHRYRIMDATIRNIDEWFFLGERNPMSWGVWEMRDITNQYIVEAVRGGFLTLALFIAMLTIAFRTVGASIRQIEGDNLRVYFAWCIGATLFVHVGTYYGVAYFGQIIMLVYLTLAMIGSLPDIIRQDRANRVAAVHVESVRSGLVPRVNSYSADPYV
jgi:hypothetical protein